MGQIFGLGYSGGDKSKAQTTPQIPLELSQMYKRQTNLAQGLMPQYSDLLSKGLSGDTSAVAPYTKPLESAYTPMAASYLPTESTYTPTAWNYWDVSHSFTPTANTIDPGVEAYTAPYQQAIQQSQDQIRRATPSGGAQISALANANMQGGVQMGAARAAQAQRFIDARNAARIADLGQAQRLQETDIANRNQLGQKDLATLQALRTGDVQEANKLRQGDLQQLATLRTGDVQQDNAMMQKLLQYYAGIFGGFNPQTQVGSTQTSSTGGRLGLPFADIGIGS